MMLHLQSRRKYVRDGEIVYQLFYDLEKVFDTVEFSIILSHTYKCGIKGKTWRIIRSVYEIHSALSK